MCHSRARMASALLISFRELQWRRRRFAIAVLSAGLVLGLALLLSGISASFDNEIERTLTSFRADAWLVRAGSIGAFTAPATFPEEETVAVRRLPGVRRASPLVLVSATMTAPRTRLLNVTGIVAGGVGASTAGRGNRVAPRVAIADASLGLGSGSRVVVNGVSLRVAGRTHGRTYFGGTPTLVVALEDAQRIAFGGAPLATAVVTEGVPRRLPPGFTALSETQVRHDLARPVEGAKSTISLIRWLLWVVAAGIIGAIVYLSVLERVPQFAVLKGIGLPTSSLLLGLAIEATTLAAGAVLLAAGFEAAMQTAVAIPVEVPSLSYGSLPIVALVAASLASALAFRRVISIDPALAFRGGR
jgi:putative ABC transport system permease protein